MCTTFSPLSFTLNFKVLSTIISLLKFGLWTKEWSRDPSLTSLSSLPKQGWLRSNLNWLCPSVAHWTAKCPLHLMNWNSSWSQRYDSWSLDITQAKKSFSPRLIYPIPWVWREDQVFSSHPDDTHPWYLQYIRRSLIFIGSWFCIPSPLNSYERVFLFNLIKSQHVQWTWDRWWITPWPIIT